MIYYRRLGEGWNETEEQGKVCEAESELCSEKNKEEASFYDFIGGIRNS